MKRKIYLGKAGSYGIKQKSCKCFVELDLKDEGKGLVFSAMGGVWNHIETDMISGGQNLDELYKFFPKKMKRIHAIWKRWHLNDMHAGCEHQRALGWETEGYNEHPSEPCPVCSYKFGTAWKIEQLPNDIVKEIKTLIGHVDHSAHDIIL